MLSAKASDSCWSTRWRRSSFSSEEPNEAAKNHRFLNVIFQQKWFQLAQKKSLKKNNKGSKWFKQKTNRKLTALHVSFSPAAHSPEPNEPLPPPSVVSPAVFFSYRHFGVIWRLVIQKSRENMRKSSDLKVEILDVREIFWNMTWKYLKYSRCCSKIWGTTNQQRL